MLFDFMVNKGFYDWEALHGNIIADVSAKCLDESKGIHHRADFVFLAFLLIPQDTPPSSGYLK
jgi:hypothetical protein